jgi:hypothetical protein
LPSLIRASTSALSTFRLCASKSALSALRLRVSVRRRTARIAGGQSSHSYTPGRDQSRSRRAPKPLTHHVRRRLRRTRCGGVTPVRRRTARIAGGQSSHSHTPGRDQSRSRRAPKPLTHHGGGALDAPSAEAVTQVRRRTARKAGGQSSHSHSPGRDRSR